MSSCLEVLLTFHGVGSYFQFLGLSLIKYTSFNRVRFSLYSVSDGKSSNKNEQLVSRHCYKTS